MWVGGVQVWVELQRVDGLLVRAMSCCNSPPRAPHRPSWCRHTCTLPVPQVLIDSRYRNVYSGRATTDDEIAGLLIALLFAGQHTSSVTSSWTGYRMLSNPKWFAAAQEEQRRVVREHGDKLDMDVLNGMDTLHLNIQEALRMNPPLIMVMRLAKESFPVTTSQGRTYVVPKVWWVGV